MDLDIGKNQPFKFSCVQGDMNNCTAMLSLKRLRAHFVLNTTNILNFVAKQLDLLLGTLLDLASVIQMSSKLLHYMVSWTGILLISVISS